jgi:hypothetical protein
VWVPQFILQHAFGDVYLQHERYSLGHTLKKLGQSLRIRHLLPYIAGSFLSSYVGDALIKFKASSHIR